MRATARPRCSDPPRRLSSAARAHVGTHTCTHSHKLTRKISLVSHAHADELTNGLAQAHVEGVAHGPACAHALDAC
eukprot:4356828-Pleurochrysis_carterae.AAC.1